MHLFAYSGKTKAVSTEDLERERPGRLSIQLIGGVSQSEWITRPNNFLS